MPSPKQLEETDKQWREVVYAKYELMYIQKFHGDGQCLPPTCDQCKNSRSIGLWRNRAGNAFAMCRKCSVDAEPPIPGITYRPTEFPRVYEPIA